MKGVCISLKKVVSTVNIVTVLRSMLNNFFLLLPVLGSLTRYMTPTLDTALVICGSPGQGRTTSFNHLLVDSVHRASPLYL